MHFFFYVFFVIILNSGKMLHKTSVVYCINAFVSLPFTSMNYWPSVHAFQSCNLVPGKTKS